MWRSLSTFVVSDCQDIQFVNYQISNKNNFKNAGARNKKYPSYSMMYETIERIFAQMFQLISCDYKEVKRE